jgi:hypothetical protein
MVGDSFERRNNNYNHRHHHHHKKEGQRNATFLKKPIQFQISEDRIHPYDF